jgi:hypothetical protein
LKLKGILLIALLAMLALPIAGCKGNGENIGIPIYVNNPGGASTVKLADIIITPGWINVAVGDTQLLKATGRYTDGTQEDFTDKVIWTINGSDWTSTMGYFPTFGKLITSAPGSLTIKVRYKGELHGLATISVFDPMIDAPPKPPENLSYIILPNGDVVLSWEIMGTPDPDLLGFNIYRSRNSGSGYIEINEGLGVILGTSYRDPEAAGGVFYYVVTAEDLGGNESDYSFELVVDKR